MADDNKEISKAFQSKLDLLDKKMDSLYKDTYISRPTNKNNLDTIINNMDNIIDKLQGNDNSISGMTELLKRVDEKENSAVKNLNSSVRELFDDPNIVGTLAANNNIHRYIAGQNYNYDLICKYLPKLQEALNIKKDNVLCAENLSKNFLNPIPNKSSEEAINQFNINVKNLEVEYELEEFFEKSYDNVSKYGEEFIYVVPYKVAFERLFKRANFRLNGHRPGTVNIFEGYDASTETVIGKNVLSSTSFKAFKEANESLFTHIGEDGKSEPVELPSNLANLKIHFNKSGTITSAVNEYAVLHNSEDIAKFESLTEAFTNSFDEEGKEPLTEANRQKMLDSVYKMNSKISKNKNSISTDGLILNNIADRDASKIDDDLLGAVVERLPRENVIPVYIGKKCIGYYYFEFGADKSACGFCGGHHAITTGYPSGVKFAYDMTEEQEELAIRYISSIISNSIDTKFINANKDLKEEIYTILKYNDKFDAIRTNDIGITFIPAEDIIHCYFKFDEDSHRGISDLADSLIPAMLYILLYLTDIIGKITRSTDKRVYYVKQNVETNIARTMMNVVQQIKKGNMGMRQIESMNNILNIVGKYNDYVIPIGPSGDPPIQFEVMQGQTIETPTDIMEKMEEAAVNPIMPFEFVNSTFQTDFATRFSMSNSRFLTDIAKRQSKAEKFFSKIFTKIYNYEFNENNKLIKIMLPPPVYLVNNNNSQLFDTITQMADKIIDVDLYDEEDEVKSEFKKLYIRDNLSTYFDYDKIDKLRKLAQSNVETNKVPSTEDGDNSDMMDDM